MQLRDHIWHRHDLSGKFCVVRDLAGRGQRNLDENDIFAEEKNSWGGSAAAVFETGRLGLLHIVTPVKQQVAWLVEQQANLLLTSPSNLRAIAEYCQQEKIDLPTLSHLSTFGEVMIDEIRTACRQTWGLKVTNNYSSSAAGVMALQCPDYGHYHVQSEVVLLEVLDKHNQPCLPGAVGRVVVTVLHNFATPLIRYATGDYAEVGEPCGCGRGLPVLRRILGADEQHAAAEKVENSRCNSEKTDLQLKENHPMQQARRQQSY